MNVKSSNADEEELLSHDESSQQPPAVQSDLDVHEDEFSGAKQSITSGMFNMVNATLGSGVLTLPYDMAVSGWALGLVLCFSFAALSTWSYFKLMKAADIAKKYQYNTLSDKLYPRWVGFIAVTCAMTCASGAIISYVIVIRDNFFFFSNNQLLFKNLLLIGVMLLIILPLCLIPSLEHFKINSYLTVIVICFVTMVVIYNFIIKGHVHATVKPIKYSLDFLKALPLTSQAFSAFYSFLNIYKELGNRKKNGKYVVLGDIGSILVLYLILGIFGYLSYGEQTQSDILRNIAAESGILSNIANVAMVIYIILHYPMPVYAFRKAIEQLIFKTDEYHNKVISGLISAGLICIATLIGVFIDQIDVVLAFTSSLAGGTLSLILPGCYCWRVGELVGDKRQRIQGIVLSCIGVLVTGFGFGMAVYGQIGK